MSNKVVWNGLLNRWVTVHAEKPPRPTLPPMIGCEPPAWVKVDNMERFLATLPANVEPTEIVEVFVRTGCPVERFVFSGEYWCVAVSVQAELAQECEVV